MFEKKSTTDGVSQIISGINSFMSGGGQNSHGFDISMVSSILSAMITDNNVVRGSRDTERKEEQGVDWSNLIGMFFQQSTNNDAFMGFMPMLLEALGHATNDNDAGNKDHSGHSWFLPPILENIHVMWEHFRYCHNFTVKRNERNEYIFCIETFTCRKRFSEPEETLN